MLKAGSSRPAWEGVKSIMGKSHVSLNRRSDLVLANELNNFYNRFNSIRGCILLNCADPLPDMFTFSFSVSLHLHKVLSLWKDSFSVPVPTSASPKSLDDFRPVALTSPVMKSRLILREPTLLPVFYSSFHLLLTSHTFDSLVSSTVTPKGCVLFTFTVCFVHERA